MLLTTLLAVAAVGPHSYRARFPSPDSTVSAGWGVNIHFTREQPGELQQIANAGFKWVRLEFVWSDIERKKGVYDFSAYEVLLRQLKLHQLRALVTLTWRNPLYEDVDPATDAASTIFGSFAAACAKHFRRQGVIWETSGRTEFRSLEEQARHDGIEILWSFSG